jgi:(2Fe-2S) ferredoxin
LANVQVTGDRLATTQEIANAVFASVPNITTQQAQTIAEQVIASGKPVTNQEIVNAVAATIPAVAPTTTPTTTPTTLATQTITAPKPATVEEIVNAITATIPTVTPAQAQTVAEQVITSDRPVTTQEVINAITATIPLAPEPRLTITADRPSSITDIVTAATIPLIQPSTPLTAPAVTAQTTTDPLRVAQLALTTAGLLGAGTALSGGTTQYPIVPIPDTFLTPATPAVAPYAKLPAIDFGDSNLLRGTQWEKFLSPNYGKVPLPVQYSQPSKLSYNDLMGILGSRQGMPAKSSLSINDIISGIQNQYGQTPVSTMG